MPLVPTIGSMMMAATDLGLSYMSCSLSTASVFCPHSSASVEPKGQRYGIRAEEMHDAGDARLRRPAARVSRQRDGPRRGAVVALPGRVDLVPAGEPARGLDGVLIRLRAAVGEQHVVQVSRGHLRHHGGELGLGLGAEPGDTKHSLSICAFMASRTCRLPCPRLIFSRPAQPSMMRLAVRVVHVDALGMIDHRGLPAALRLPAVDDVLAVQLLQFLGLHSLSSCHSAVVYPQCVRMTSRAPITPEDPVEPARPAAGSPRGIRSSRG